MLNIIGLMFLGIIIGRIFFYNRKFIIKLNYKLMNISLYILIFSLSISIAQNKVVLENLSFVGINSILLAIGSVIGSVFVCYFVHKILFKNKFKR